MPVQWQDEGQMVRTAQELCLFSVRARVAVDILRRNLRLKNLRASYKGQAHRQSRRNAAKSSRVSVSSPKTNELRFGHYRTSVFALLSNAIHDGRYSEEGRGIHQAKRDI